MCNLCLLGSCLYYSISVLIKSLNLLRLKILVFLHEPQHLLTAVSEDTTPVQQGQCDGIAVPLLHLGNFMKYPTRGKFAVTHNIVQNVEHSCDILRLPLITHAQSIGDKHSRGKQGVELFCSPRGVVLYGGIQILRKIKP